MQQFLSEHLESILTFVGGLFAGGFITFKFDRRNSYKVSQKNINTFGGDVAGRDINK